MEISNETKAKIFAHYFLQKIIVGGSESEPKEVGEYTLKCVQYGAFTNSRILVKPLSSITDEDATEVTKIMGVDYSNEEGSEAHFDLVGFSEWLEELFSEPAGYFVDGYSGNQILNCIDYLRSKSYALPYLNYSVEDLVAAGIYKLTQ